MNPNEVRTTEHMFSAIVIGALRTAGVVDQERIDRAVQWSLEQIREETASYKKFKRVGL